MLPLPVASRVAVPRVKTLVVSLKVTVPVGVGPEAEVTFAEKVTDWPKIEGFGAAAAVTVAPVPSTTWLSAVEVLAAWPASPAYAAVMEWEPTARALVAKVAVPAAFNMPVPRALVASLKVTVPVGVPDVEVTVAVNVTVCPVGEGFSDDERVVVVVGPVIVWVSTVEVLAVWVASPP
jgi:hypothetical protein